MNAILKQVQPEIVDQNPLALVTLDPVRYVAEVFKPFSEKFAILKAEADTIKPDATTTAGMEIAVKYRAAFRDEIRIAGDKARAERKAPILTIGRLLDSKYKEIADEAAPYEAKFNDAIKAEESRKEAEKQAKIAAERARVESIHAAIASIREKAFSANGHKSGVIAKLRGEVADAPISPEAFAEFLPQAMEAVAQTLAKLDQMIAEAEANEAADAESARLAALEVARVAAERAALEAQRAEQERIANEQAKVARELAAQQAAIEAAAKQQREAAEANLRAERAAADAEIKAAQAKLNEELAAFELAKRIEVDHAEAIAIDIESTDSLAKYAALRTPESILDAVDAGEISIADVSPTDAEIVDVYVEHFGGTRDEAVARLINFSGDEV